MMKFQPLADRVVIRPDTESEEKTAGGVIIPDVARERPLLGTVIAVGPGARTNDGATIPMTLMEGDRVIYGKFAGTEIKIDQQRLLILRETDVYGVLRPTPTQE